MKPGKLLLVVVVTFVLVFLWLPLLFVFAKGADRGALQSLWARQDIAEAFLQSLGLALATSFLATLLATLTAFATPRLSPRLLQFLDSSFLIPMILPEVVFGLAYLVWFLRLGLTLGWLSLLLGHLAFSFSYAVFVMKISVQKINWQIWDAAQDLGASPWPLFRHALLPQLIPGFTASTLMVFSLSLDDFFISFFLKGLNQMTLPIQIFSMMRVRITPEVYALAVLLFCLSLATVLSSQLWIKRNSL